MPLRVREGADPLSDESLQSPDDEVLVNAQSEAGRLLRLELKRYCRGEINGRSFLVAGHRGAGKTTMVSDAIDRVLRLSRKEGSEMLRPLPVFLHGPSLFEIDAEPAAAKVADGEGSVAPAPAPMAAQAKGALTQIILCLHRAVVKEFARAYRLRVVSGPTFRARPAAERLEFAELAAQFEAELMADPSPARLRDFWAMAEAMGSGVLFDETPGPGGDAPRLDRGALELVAVSGMCDAYQRISGEMSLQKRGSDSDERSAESQAGMSLKGGELVRPVVSVLSGVAVAGGVAGQVHSTGGALLAGLATALASSLMFSASSTRTVRSSRQSDTTFIPDLTLRTLDRVLPTLLQRLREAGLAPVLIIDELDKVEALSARLVAMIHFLKKLVAENVFTCFLTDRNYFEQLQLRGSGAYDASYSYFSHALLVTYQPADYDRYLGRLLVAETPAAQVRAPSPEPGDEDGGAGAVLPVPGGQGDALDLEVLKWVLRHRCELHALTLTREITRLCDEENIVQIPPGVVRTEISYRIALTFQVVIELQLAQPRVASWLRLHPERSQMLIDALFFLSRLWMDGFEPPDPQACGEVLRTYLVRRMNLDEASESVLVADDLKLLSGIVAGMMGCLGPDIDGAALQQRWERVPEGGGVMPPRPVLEALLVGRKSLLVLGDGEEAPRYAWRYPRSDLLGGDDGLRPPAPPEAELPEDTPDGAAPRAMADSNRVPKELQRQVERIREIESTLASILHDPGDQWSHGEVFELLAETWRVLPTSPAWQPVSGALAAIEFRRLGAELSSVAAEARDVEEFLAMLDDYALAVSDALLAAAFLAGSGTNVTPSRPKAMQQALQALSAGLRFAERDATGLSEGIAELNRQALESMKAALFHMRFDRLDDPDLSRAVENTWADGSRLLAAESRQTKADLAWEALRQRLEHSQAEKDLLIPLLPEFVADAARVGPAHVLGLDLEQTTLAQWTTAVMVGAEITHQAVQPHFKIPRWVVQFALNQLRANNLSPIDCLNFLRWLLPDLSDREIVVWRERILTSRILQDMSANSVDPDVHRFGLCISLQGDAMRLWRSPPDTGFVLVATPGQAELLIARGLFDIVSFPAVIAVSRVDGATAIKPNALQASKWPVVTVTNRAERRSPDRQALLNPSTPDEVLKFADSSLASPSRH